jgi:CMP-N-acetylneuraminic acid synthetase
MWTKVRVSLRPEEYCGDAVGGNKLLERFITPVGCFMQAHVTSPFLKHTTINKAFEELSNLKNGCVFSVTQIQQRVYTHDYSPINFDVEGPIKRTQDLDPVYHENGAFFAFHGEAYLANGNRRNPTDSVPSVMLPLEFPETVDIDTEEDFSLAEAIIKGGIHDR